MYKAVFEFFLGQVFCCCCLFIKTNISESDVWRCAGFCFESGTISVEV